MAPATTQVIDLLEQSRLELQQAAAGVMEVQARLQPGPSSWCVLECVEHVTVVEENFITRVAQGRSEAPPRDPEREAKIEAMVAGRAGRMEAPPAALPTGRFSSLAEALGGFDAVRARTARFAVEQGPELYSTAARHPMGLLNGQEVVIFLAAHARRHAAQIREIRAALGF